MPLRMSMPILFFRRCFVAECAGGGDPGLHHHRVILLLVDSWQFVHTQKIHSNTLFLFPSLFCSVAECAGGGDPGLHHDRGPAERTDPGGGVPPERARGLDQLVRLRQLRDHERLHGHRLLPRPHGERGSHPVSEAFRVLPCGGRGPGIRIRGGGASMLRPPFVQSLKERGGGGNSMFRLHLSSL